MLLAGAQVAAVGALRDLADGNPANQAAIAEAGAIAPLVSLLGSSNTTTVQVGLMYA